MSTDNTPDTNLHYLSRNYVYFTLQREWHYKYYLCPEGETQEEYDKRKLRAEGFRHAMDVIKELCEKHEPKPYGMTDQKSKEATVAEKVIALCKRHGLSQEIQEEILRLCNESYVDGSNTAVKATDKKGIETYGSASPTIASELDVLSKRDQNHDGNTIRP